MYTIEIDKALGPLFEALHKHKVVPDGKTISDGIFSMNPVDLVEAYKAIDPTSKEELMAFYKAHFTIQSNHSDFISDTDLPLRAHIEKLWDHWQGDHKNCKHTPP